METNPSNDARIIISRKKGPLESTRSDFRPKVRARRTTAKRRERSSSKPVTIPNVIIAGMTEALHPISSLIF